jgi:hypothetical protein
MPGGLRSVVFPAPGVDEEPAWVLGTFGLGRLHLGPQLAVTDVVRKGVGKYRASLIDFDEDLLAIGHGRVHQPV